MHRLKQLWVIGAFFTVCSSACAQKMYAGFAAGYGLSMASQSLASNVNNGNIHTSASVVRGSLGKGFHLNGSVGYLLRPKTGLEINVSYLDSWNYRSEYRRENAFVEKTTLSATMLRLTPAFRLNLAEGKIRPYITLGVVFRLTGNIWIDDMYVDLQTQSETRSTWKYSKGFSLGLSSSAGAIYLLNPKLAIFAGLDMISQSWGPKRGILTRYEIDGVDMIPNMSPSQKEIDFLDNYTATNYNPSAGWSHRQQLRQYYPFSSIGINAGIHFILGKQ
ncbi:MAG: hypothetical protein JWO09_1338 [Bacteroidetes bacterium]|nr:hypothetical protein [Bacteroidota bacterium]